MSFDNENADNFVDLWKKKKTQQESTPTIRTETTGKLADTQLKFMVLQNENIELKKKIVELLAKVEKLEKDNETVDTIVELQKKNVELRKKITKLEEVVHKGSFRRVEM